MLILAVAVTIIMAFTLVPAISNLYSAMGAQLPLATKIMIIDTFQQSVESADGRTIRFRSTLRRSFSADGQVSGGQWVAADVTLQVEAERGVQNSERQLHQLSSRHLHLQDEERRRIARELHDSTAQSLSALEMNVSLLDPIARDDRTKRIVAKTRRIAQDCCKELRNISCLRPFSMRLGSPLPSNGSLMALSNAQGSCWS